MRTSKYYVTTLDPLSAVDMEKLAMIRKTVSMVNSVTDTKQYVKLHGRGPRILPAFSAGKSISRFQQELPLAYAQRFDVYIYNRRS